MSTEVFVAPYWAGDEFVEGYYTLVEDEPKGQAVSEGDEKPKEQSQDKGAESEGKREDERPRGVDPDYHARIKRERDEFDKRLKDLTAKEEEREKNELAEQKKFREIAEKAEAKAREREAEVLKVRAEFETRVILAEAKKEAIKLGVIDEDAVRLADLKDCKVEDGEVVGVKEAIERFKERKPKWFESKEESGAKSEAKNEGEKPRKSVIAPASGGKKDAKPVDFSKMSDAEFKKHLDAVKAGDLSVLTS